MEIIEVQINKIRPDPKQPRQSIDKERVADMAKSIITEGVINPIEVDQDLIIITGELRWRAAREAGLKTVPCKIVSIDADIRFRRQVIENIHHNTMTDWDTAVALGKLLKERGGYSPGEQLTTSKGGRPGEYHQLEKFADELGKSEGYITEHLDLLRAPKEIKEAIRNDKLPFAYLRPLRATPEKYHKQIMQKILRGEFTSRDTTATVVSALKKYPKYSRQILGVDYKNDSIQTATAKIKKIIPDFTIQPMTDLIKSGDDAARELHRAVDAIVRILKERSPRDFGQIHLPNVVLSLDLLHNTIREWVGSVKHPQLREGK